MGNTNKDTKRFLQIFTISAIVMLLGIATFIYVVDPFFQYRVKDKQYILNPIYVNPGLAKNYDYNTVIIGSSMVQNYDLSMLKRDTLVKPVKLASGAMTIVEMNQILSFVDFEKVNTFIINLDMIQFNEWYQKSKYPDYLHSGKPLDRLRYHFAYESVVRYGLTDLLLYPYLAYEDEENIPAKLKLRYSVEDIGNFSLEATYNDAERIKRMLHNGQTVNLPYVLEMNYRMKRNIDSLLSYFDLENHQDKEIIFVLPPYSVLYWSITKNYNYFQHITNNIKYICRETEKYKNVRIQFYYNLDQITDLNRYSDVTHFDPATSNFMLENLRNDKYTITTHNMNQWINTLDSTIIKYRKDNADWINN